MKNINYSLILLVFCIIKTVVFAASFADAFMVLGLLAYMGMEKYIEFRTPKEYVDLKTKKDVEEIKNALTKVNIAQAFESKPEQTKKRYF